MSIIKVDYGSIGGGTLALTRMEIATPYGTNNWKDTGVAVEHCKGIFFDNQSHNVFVTATIENNQITYVEQTNGEVKIDNGTVWIHATYGTPQTVHTLIIDIV